MISPLAALLRLHEIHLAKNGTPDAPRNAEVSRLLQALTPALHQRYVNTLRRHGVNAVAPLEHGICMGCFMRQPSQPQQIDEGLFLCQHCGRILYDRDEAYEASVG